MPRPKKTRKIDSPPMMKGFKPFGIKGCKAECLTLTFEEYESIRLINYEALMQDEAAKKMEVSRPTLTRIYNKALKIIAQAFVEGKSIVIEGGDFSLEKDWYRCKKCYLLIEGIENHQKCGDCISYNNNELVRINN